MKKSVFYHAGCPVCLTAEQEILTLLDNSKLEIVNLDVSKDRVIEAEKAGLKSVPALVTPTGNVLHINFGASITDLK